MQVYWTQEHMKQAQAEGWDVFENSDYGTEIERIDCPDDDGEPLFESDDAAVAHVILQARVHGSRLHQDALAFVAQQRSLE